MRNFSESRLRDAVDKHFAVMVHLVGGVAIAVEADVAAFGTFALDDATVVGFNVGGVFAFAESEGVVVVGVEDGGDTGFELRVIGDLDDDVDISLSLLVVVPHEDLLDGGGFFEIDLDPLRAGSQFDEGAVSAIWIAIGNEGEIADDGGGVGRSDGFAFGDKNGAFRNFEFFDDFVWIWFFEVWEFGGNRGADEHGFRELRHDCLHVAGRGGGFGGGGSRSWGAGRGGGGFGGFAAGREGESNGEAASEDEVLGGVLHVLGMTEWL